MTLWFEVFFGVIAAIAAIGGWLRFCWWLSDGEAWGAFLFVGPLFAALIATVVSAVPP